MQILEREGGAQGAVCHGWKLPPPGAACKGRVRHLLLLPGAAGATTLDIGLAGDPGLLDPARSGNYIDRNVFASVCDKLIETNPDQTCIPALATRWEWSAHNLALTLHLRTNVRFQDGALFDAAAGAANIEREKTLPGSLRKSELAPAAGVEVVDPATVRIRLSALMRRCSPHSPIAPG